MLVSCWLYSKDLIALPLLGAPAAILAGECWFALNGLFAKKEEESEVSGAEEEITETAERLIHHYRILSCYQRK